MKYLILVLGAAVLFGLGGVLIWKYGESKDEAGYNRAIAEQSAAAAEGAVNAGKDLEESNNEAKKYFEDGRINDLLYDLGIMRVHEDY